MKRTVTILLATMLISSHVYAHKQFNSECEKLNNTSWSSDFVAVNGGYFHCIYTANVHFTVQNDKVTAEMSLSTDDKDCKKLATVHHIEGICRDQKFNFLNFYLEGANEIRGYYKENLLHLGGTIQFRRGYNVGIDTDLTQE